MAGGVTLSELIGKVDAPSLEQKPNHRCPRVRRPLGLAPGFLFQSDAWMSSLRGCESGIEEVSGADQIECS